MAGVNAAIRSVVKTSIAQYGSEVVGIMNGFEGLLHPPQVRSLGLKDVHGFIRKAGTSLGTDLRGDPFHQVTEEGTVDRSDELIRSFRWLGLDCLIALGGAGTVGLAQRIAALGLPLIVIPKSTTNELPATDLSIGFSTAVETAIAVIDRLHSVVEEDHRVLYVEVMGRDAGWTALTAAVSGGAHVALLPELPYDLKEIDQTIQKRSRAKRPSTIIVVAAGAQSRGQRVRARRDLDTLTRLAPALQEINGFDYDITALGPVQRGGQPNGIDRLLATRFGFMAVKAAHEGLNSHLITLRGETIEAVPLAEISDELKTVDPRGQLVDTALSQGISLGVDPAGLRSEDG